MLNIVILMPHHCSVQLPLNVHVYVLFALLGVMDRKSFREKKRGVRSHLKIGSLKKQNI